jgi:hypothetical protein
MNPRLTLSCLVTAALAGSACAIDLGHEAYVERVEQRFDAATPVDLQLTTFDGTVEVRGWDRPEVLVTIEKRGQTKEAVAEITVVADRKANRIQVEARHAGSRGVFVGLGTFTSTSARLIANVPRKTNLVVRTADGAVLVERVEGKIELRTEDGAIKVRETAGDLLVDTGDGAILLEDVSGKVDARTGDGSLRITGTPAVLHAKSGDGAIILRVGAGTVMTDRWTVSTGDGSISAELPEGFDAEIEADPGSDGRARNQLALTEVSGGTRSEPTLRGRLGKGGHALQLRTGDGTIRLMK